MEVAAAQGSRPGEPGRATAVHSELSRLFASLQETGVEWSLLRLPRDLELPPGAVDAVLAGSSLSAASLRDLAAAGDWSGLAGAAARLRAAWLRALGRRGRRDVHRAQVRRALSRPGLYTQRRGLSVALLGTNGAG